ncbi:MAG: cobyrinate a,c-diamide synthase, partial [Anaerolineales bacterium]
HGLFDSFDESGTGSTAAVARSLDAPILLVVNATRMGRSAAAIVHGCQTFEADTNIAGVVLNQVAHGRHEIRMRAAIERHCHIPVIGAIPRGEQLVIPDRHLGLVPRAEQETLLSAISACRQAVEKYLDLEAILRIAERTSPVLVEVDSARGESNLPGPRARIGVLRDRAFTFYYPENLEALEAAGADLICINALAEAQLPPLDALYIGGGFPEIFMDELSANVSLRGAIRGAVAQGLPVYAECGGMMYLSRRITWGEKSAEMVGVLPCEIEMTGKPQGHGYVAAQVDESNPFFAKGTTLRGHEFHNSRVVTHEPLNTAYHLSRGNGLGDGRDGIVIRNVLASYTHLHVGGAGEWARNLIRRAQAYRQSRAAGGS